MQLNDGDYGYRFGLPDIDVPEYSSFIGALQHAYYCALGDFSKDGYVLGGNLRTKIMLQIYFYIAQFLFCVHLLNMLISLMIELFYINMPKKAKLITKSHL